MGVEEIFSGLGKGVAETPVIKQQTIVDKKKAQEDKQTEKIHELLKTGAPNESMKNLMDRAAEIAVKMGVIPEVYKDDILSRKKVMQSYELMNRTSSRKFIMVNLEQVLDTMEAIIQTINRKERLPHSFLIGSPNGFGKTSFVNTCLKLMVLRGMDTVPFISLSELAQLKQQVDDKLFYGHTLTHEKLVYKEETDDWEVEKVPIECISRFSWNEYLNADILFTFFTSVEYKVVESRILKTILTLRASKGLPTVVMISSSVKNYFQPYMTDKNLAEWYWDEIYTQSREMARLDRVWHISTFKNYAARISQTIEGK